MSTLYEITDDIRALEEMIEASMVDAEGNPRDPTEEEKFAILDMIAETEEAFRAKAERICKFRADLIGDAEKFKAEEERLARRRRTKENKAAALKMYLDLAMERIGQDKIEAGVFRLRRQNNPPSVYVAMPDLLAEDYFHIIPESREIDKVKIKKDFAVGAYPWGAIVQAKSLRIE